MKLTAFLIFAAIMQVSAATYAQKLTLHQKNVTLKQLFDEIRKQTGYDVLYQPGKVNTAYTFNADFSETPLPEVLDAGLNGQPLDYVIEDKTVVIREKEPNLLDRLKNALAPAVTVTAKVYNELGQPMAGVNVRQKGTQNGATTDSNGNFNISVPDDKSVLVFSFIGYETQELTAKDIPAGSVITLKVAENNLREVVINKGVYNEKRELSVSDVGVVDAKTIEDQPVFDPIQSLIGRVAGLNIQQTSGVPGAYASINIRGINSVVNGNDPFYIVDGVPFSSLSLSSTAVNAGALGSSVLQNNGNAGGGMSPFNGLNPDDIEKIEVLKDADATAIYGSRGANGVIIITTKKGKAGDTRVNFDLSQGIGQVGHYMDLLNTQQYLQMMHQAFTNDGLTYPSITSNPQDFNYDIDGVWDTTRNTNWQKALIGGTAHYTNAQGSIFGGNTNTQFLISGGYTRQTTVYPGDYEDRKGSLHFSLNHTSSNQKFHMQLTGGYVNDNNVLPPLDFASLINLPPDAPALRNPNGSLNWEMYSGSATFYQNPLAQTVNTDASITNNLISNLDLSYQLLPGLTLKSDFGYNHEEMDQTQLALSGSIPPPYNSPSLSEIEYPTTTIEGWSIDPQLSYSKIIAKGQLNVLIGGTIQQTQYQSVTPYAYGFTSDALVTDPQAATYQGVQGTQYSLDRYEAWVARAGYTWEDKYLLNLTANRDGSSRFGPGKQFANFGSIGAGWIFSREKAIQDKLSWLSFGKLRASFGTSGNYQIGYYEYLSTYRPGSNSYQGISQLFPTSLTNPDYAWEVDKKLEVGLDLGFLNDRINLSVNYYRNRTGNELVNIPLATVTGFTGIQFNLPAVVQNTGLEINLNTTNLKTKDFSWTTSVNFTAPQNKLVSFTGLAASSFYKNLYVVGKSLYIKEVYQYTGVNPQTGLYTFTTQNASGLPSFPQDAVPSQPITQKYYGGIGNNFTYKGFGLNVFVQFVNQLGYNYQKYFLPPGLDGYNEPTAVLSGTNTEKFSTEDPRQYTYFTSSNGVITDASFVRIKNVALSYQLPGTWQRWAHVQNAKIYMQGQNLYTFTKYIGLDPEAPGLTLPPLRVIMLGVSATF